jgi:hypothetical protein
VTRSGVTNSIVERRGPALSTSAAATPMFRSICRSLRHAPSTNNSDCNFTRHAAMTTPIRARRNVRWVRVSPGSPYSCGITLRTNRITRAITGPP